MLSCRAVASLSDGAWVASFFLPSVRAVEFKHDTKRILAFFQERCRTMLWGQEANTFGSMGSIRNGVDVWNSLHDHLWVGRILHFLWASNRADLQTLRAFVGDFLFHHQDCGVLCILPAAGLAACFYCGRHSR